MWSYYFHKIAIIQSSLISDEVSVCQVSNYIECTHPKLGRYISCLPVNKVISYLMWKDPSIVNSNVSNVSIIVCSPCLDPQVSFGNEDQNCINAGYIQRFF